MTCADALKRAIIKIDKLLATKETKMILPIHDELIFAQHEFDIGLEKELQQIMIEAFDWCLVPVAVGIDKTSTNWREAA